MHTCKKGCFPLQGLKTSVSRLFGGDRSSVKYGDKVKDCFRKHVCDLRVFLIVGGESWKAFAFPHKQSRFFIQKLLEFTQNHFINNYLIRSVTHAATSALFQLPNIFSVLLSCDRTTGLSVCVSEIRGSTSRDAFASHEPMRFC